MKRITTIDILRGFSMFIMITGHYQFWWVKESQVFVIESIYWFYSFVTAGFLFLSGISTSISNKKKLVKINDTYTKKQYRNEYLFRVFLIFILALINNVVVTIVFGDLSDLWKWFFLLTLSFSLLLAWPLLKLSKRSRLIIALLIWAADQVIVLLLYDFKDESNFFGILYYILYNSIDQDPILAFFPYLLFGTVIGDFLFDIYKEEGKEKRIQFLKKKFLFPSLIIGMALIITAILYNFPFFLYRGVYEWMRPLPDFLNRGTISWMILTLGVCITVFTILLTIEVNEIIAPKKSYNFFYYFSYYSFLIYLAHNILYFLFAGILDAYIAIIFSIITLVFYGLLLRFLYKKYGDNVSIKIIIGKISVRFAKKIEDRKIKKNNTFNL